jgi:hypothetical protein
LNVCPVLVESLNENDVLFWSQNVFEIENLRDDPGVTGTLNDGFHLHVSLFAENPGVRILLIAPEAPFHPKLVHQENPLHPQRHDGHRISRKQIL